MKKILAIYLINLLFFTLTFILFLHSPLFSFQRVFFYRGLWLILLSLMIIVTVEIIFLRKSFFQHFESFVASIIVAVSINLTFFVIFPVTFERSVSMFLLNSLNKENKSVCSGLSESQLKNKLISDYILKNKAVEKRINEQKIINMIKDDKQCVALTSQGIGFVEFSKIIKKIYNIK